MDNLEREIKIVSSQKQNKGKSLEECTSIAKENLERREILNSLTGCLPSELEWAKGLLENYLAESSLSSYAEKDTLRQLIYLEVILERVKVYINKETEKANPVPPIQMLEQLQYLNKQIIEIKTILGLTQKEDQKTVLDEWNKLKTKALNYYKENAGCNVVKCPECKKLFMILKDMKSCVETKLPWFKKTILYNQKLYELYDQKKLTAEEMALIFGVSVDYITYIYETEYKNDKI